MLEFVLFHEWKDLSKKLDEIFFKINFNTINNTKKLYVYKLIIKVYNAHKMLVLYIMLKLDYKIIYP